MGGRIWMPIGGWHHATKHALEVLSDTLRVEAPPFGIKRSQEPGPEIEIAPETKEERDERSGNGGPRE
jgi:hypothetical protein